MLTESVENNIQNFPCFTSRHFSFYATNYRDTAEFLVVKLHFFLDLAYKVKRDI